MQIHKKSVDKIIINEKCTMCIVHMCQEEWIYLWLYGRCNIHNHLIGAPTKKHISKSQNLLFMRNTLNFHTYHIFYSCPLVVHFNFACKFVLLLVGKLFSELTSVVFFCSFSYLSIYCDDSTPSELIFFNSYTQIL